MNTKSAVKIYIIKLKKGIFQIFDPLTARLMEAIAISSSFFFKRGDNR